MRDRFTAVILVLGLVLACLVVTKSASAAPTTYYVDCTAGNDNNSGAAPEQAWLSLTKVNKAAFAPGDQLLFKRGCTWSAGLKLSRSGTASQPIYVGAYGTGEYPIIQSNRTGTHVVVVTGSYITIENLYAKGVAPTRDANCGNTAVGWINGFVFEGTAAYNTLKNSKASGLSSGIEIDTTSHHNKIIGNILTDNNMMSDLTPTSVNDNDDAGAFGIEILGDDNEVAYNTISGGNACSYDYVRDGSAIEIYGGRRNNVHHNIGLENDSFTELGDSRSADNVFAYNIVRSTLSQATFLVTRGPNDVYGPVARTRAYNNTVYLTGAESSTVECYAGCSKDILTLKNNILWSENVIGYSDRPFDEGYNLAWRSDGKPKIYFSLSGGGEGLSSTSKKANPQFMGLAVGDFHLQSASAAINIGSNDSVTAGFTIDLDGRAVPSGAAVDLGAYEFGGAVAPTATYTATAEPPTATYTSTSVPPTATRTNTAVPPTATNTKTSVPPTATSTGTAVPATATYTSTSVPPTATRTGTAVPPTATNTKTSVPPTATRTNTAIPPTATNTKTSAPPTATRTNTAVPPTATTDPGTPTTTMKLLYRTDERDTTTSEIAPSFRITNLSNQSVPLNELKIRYYFTRDSSRSLNFQCNRMSKGCRKVTGQFVPMPAPAQNADYYLEIGFTGSDKIYPNGTLDEVSVSFNKTNWSNFNQANDYSFDRTKRRFAEWANVALYRNDTLIWGTPPEASVTTMAVVEAPAATATIAATSVPPTPTSAAARSVAAADTTDSTASSSTLQTVESDGTAVQQAGQWKAQNTNSASGGRYLYSSSNPNEALRFNFQGRHLDLVYVKSPNFGTFAVEVDGATVLTVDSKASRNTFGARATVRGLSAGKHSVRVYAVSGVIAIDAFAVDPQPAAPPPTSQPAATTASAAASSNAVVAPTDVPQKAQPTQLPPATIVGLPYRDTFDKGWTWIANGAWHLKASSARQGKSWFADGSARGVVSTLEQPVSIDLRGAVRPHLVLLQKASLAAQDTLVLEITRDNGASWATLDQQTNLQTDWATRTLDLSAYQGQVIRLRFRLDTTANLGQAKTTGYWLDTLAVTDGQPAAPATAKTAATAAAPTSVPPTSSAPAAAKVQPTQASPTQVPPAQVPPATQQPKATQAQPTQVPPTQVPPTQQPKPTQVPPTKVPPTQAPPPTQQPKPTQVPPTQVPPTQIPPTQVPPTATAIPATPTSQPTAAAPASPTESK